MLDALVSGFLADPLKSLLGSGGVIGVVILLGRWWRGRAKARVSFVGETYNVNGERAVPVEVRIELENLGREPTSIVQTVTVSYRTARTDHESQVMLIQEEDRTLAPVTPRTVMLTGALPAQYLFSHFRVFTIRFTRGPAVRLRVLNASGISVGLLRFTYLKALFMVFGALPHVGG